MGKLSPIVFSIAAPMGLLAYILARRKAHPLIVGALAQGSIIGHAVALCSTDALSRYTVGLLGKKEDGFMSWWSHLVFWPYHLGLRIKLGVQRQISDEPLYTEVARGIYISGWPDAPSSLPKGPGRLAVVDVTCELPRTHSGNPYIALPTWDTTGVDVSNVERGVQFCSEQLAQGARLLVHCAHGHGRSAAVLAAVLIDQGIAKTVDEAERIMKAKRPLVRLNKHQRGAVEGWMSWRAVGGVSLQSLQLGDREDPKLD